MSTLAERSVSRGREVFVQSSGRGGAGNIRSVSREAHRTDGPANFPLSRGREPLPAATRSFSTGRGGAGNIRSPSRDKFEPTSAKPLSQPAIEEESVIRVHLAQSTELPYSSGRGGAGNIVSQSPSRHMRNLEQSRSQSRGPLRSSTGRGGAGNIIVTVAESKDDEEGKVSHHHEGIHLTGRGGVANLAPGPDPPVELPVHVQGEYESRGRGGVGNMVQRE